MAGPLVLRPWADDDARGVLELASDPVSRQWSRPMREVRTKADAVALIRQRRDDSFLYWAVCDGGSGALVGRVGLVAIDEEQRSADIRYGVGASFRGLGFARLAVETAETYAFGTLGLVRVNLRHAVRNDASCAVAAACGFPLEGVGRAALDYGDGVRHDVHQHARLASGAAADHRAPAATNPAIEPTELRSGRWLLRPPRPHDAPGALDMLLDPLMAQWNPAPHVTDLDAARAWCARGADWSSGGHATFSIVDDHDCFAGNVSLHRIDIKQARAHIGYGAAPQARQQGVATAGVVAVSRWAFDVLGLVRIELFHAVANGRSCGVAEKAGYALEATLREATRYGDGRRYDDHLHARLARDPRPSVEAEVSYPHHREGGPPERR